MRILHLATFLQGGAGRIITDLAIRQRELGHDVTVVTSLTAVPGYGNYPAYLDELRAERVAVHEIDSLFHRDFDANLAVARALAETVAPDAAIEIVHTHAAVPTFIGRLFLGSRHADSPIVQTMHGWGVSKTVSQAAWDIGLMNLADRVAVPSAHSAQLLASRGLPWAKLTVVPYGTRASVIEPDAADRARMDAMADARRRGALVVACIGTIGPRKNQRLLVDALTRLSGQPMVQAVFVGDGDTTDLDLAIGQAGLRAVHVHGYSPAARKIAASADAIVLPSRSEGQPLAILEAFQDGVLVLASDIPELRELVDDGVTGLTFPADDAGALAGALMRLAVMPEAAREQIRAQARARHAVAFSTPAMVCNYINLYHLARRARMQRHVARAGISPAA